MKQTLPIVKTKVLRSVDDAYKLLSDISHNLDEVKHLTTSFGDSKTSLDWLYGLKFTKFARDPLFGNIENFIELVNQTFTYIVTIRSCIELFQIYSDTDMILTINLGNTPGADIYSNEFQSGDTTVQVFAETFASVTKSNNNKLRDDIERVKQHKQGSENVDVERYVFYHTPKSEPQYTKDGVMIRWIDVLTGK